MNDYKYVNKYLTNKNKKRNKFKTFLSIILTQILICIILFLLSLIILKKDENLNKKVKKYLYETNINFTYFTNIYNKYLGNIIPIKDIFNNTTLVFNENIKYSDSSIYKDGVKLEVEENYLVPVLEDGVVVFVGEKEGYKNTVIVQQEDNLYTWYGNVSNLNVKIYDHVKKGEFLGQANKVLYLVFQGKDGFLDYKKYIK